MSVVAVALVAVASGCSTNEPPYSVDGCTPADLGGRSVARVWDEEVLSLIRQVVPAPTVHARNLFHTSAAMWDAWAAYDPTSDGYFVTEKLRSGDVAAAREAAISYAAYRILVWRYATVSDLPSAVEELDDVMASLCFRTDVATTEGDSPAALGNRIAATIIEFGADDGALEDERYVDHSYRPSNDPLVVADPGTVDARPERLAAALARVAAVAERLAHPRRRPDLHRPPLGPCRLVRARTLDRREHRSTPARRRVSTIPRPTPRTSRPRSTCSATARELDPRPTWSRSTSVQGRSVTTRSAPTMGTATTTNPVTGDPYEPNLVLRADFLRVIAEYWADGPTSETPPGHWNLLANATAEAPGFERRVGGSGPRSIRWSGTSRRTSHSTVPLHDAAIAAWGLKAHYDSVRPISMIRYLGGSASRRTRTAPSYDPDGLPLSCPG